MIDSTGLKTAVQVLEKNGGICPADVQDLILRAISIVKGDLLSENPWRCAIESFLRGSALLCENLQRERRPESPIALERISGEEEPAAARKAADIWQFFRQLKQDLKNQPPGTKP